MSYRYYTSCVSAREEDISDMVDAEREVSYRTLAKNVPEEELRMVFTDYEWD